MIGFESKSHRSMDGTDVELDSTLDVTDESPYFVVIGGGKPGVYDSEAGVFDAVTSAGGFFEH